MISRQQLVHGYAPSKGMCHDTDHCPPSPFRSSRNTLCIFVTLNMCDCVDFIKSLQWIVARIYMTLCVARFGNPVTGQFWRPDRSFMRTLKATDIAQEHTGSFKDL